jgi:hypothetical protein
MSFGPQQNVRLVSGENGLHVDDHNGRRLEGTTDDRHPLGLGMLRVTTAVGQRRHETQLVLESLRQ